MILPALNLALTLVLYDIPWFILCCVPFMPMRKIEVRTMAFRIAAISVGFFLFYIGLVLVMGGVYQQVVVLFRILLYPVMLVAFFRAFDVGWWKVLYVFFFEQAVATFVNLWAYFITYYVFQESTALTNGLWMAGSVWLVLIVVFPLMWWFFKQRLRPAMALLSDKQVRQLCIIPFFFFVTCVLYGNMSMFVDMDVFENLIFSGLFCLIGVAAYIVTLKSTVDVVEAGRMERSVLEMEQQLEKQSQRFSQLQQSIAQARSARHDLRHHLAIIERYTNAKDLDGLQGYLKEYLSYLPTENENPVCKNFAVDVLVRNYLQQAKTAGAELDIKINLPAKIAIPDSQLCIVFGNIFENAVHAIEQQQSGRKFIRVRCVTEERQLILTVDNSTEDLYARITPGIGLSSVQAVVDMYEGTLIYEIKDGMFQTSVMMFMNDTSKITDAPKLTAYGNSANETT